MSHDTSNDDSDSTDSEPFSRVTSVRTTYIVTNACPFCEKPVARNKLPWHLLNQCESTEDVNDRLDGLGPGG